MPRFKIRDFVNSITLNGSSSFLAKASPTGINNGTNGSVTISGWVYLTSNVLGTFAELHVNGTTSPAFGIGQSGGAYYVFSDRVNAGNNKTITTAAFNNSVGLNRWVMLTYVLTSTNITVYAGATAILPTTALGTSISAGTISSLFIGKGQDVGQSDIQFLSGIIKDFRIFNGALTSTEVSNLYYNGVSPASIASAFVMGEGSGTTVADSVGSNSLTATSITWGTSVPLAPRVAASNRFVIRDIPYSTYINGVDGAAPNALSFANSPSLNPTAAVAVEIWFKPIGTPKSYRLFDNSQAGTTDSYFVSGDANGRISWFTTIGGVARNLVNSGSLRVKWNEWNCFCGTYTGSAVYLYLNGQKFTEEITGISGTLGVNTGILRVGAYFSGALGITFLGNVYRPRIYAAGMTLAEHQDRYYRNITSPALQAALALDCAMAEGSGSTIADLSGNGNTGTLNASASWASNTPFKARKSSVNPNLVKNGDFEYAPPFTAATTTAGRYIDGTAGGSTTNNLFGFTLEANNTGGTYSTRFDTSTVYAGLSALKVSTLATASACTASIVKNVATAADVINYGIRVTPNTAYNYSFRMKTVANSGTATTGAHLRLTTFTAAGASVTSVDSTKLLTTVDWTEYTGTFVTGSTAVYIVPLFRVIGNDGSATLIMDAWFDDIYLAPTTNPGRIAIT